MVATKDKLTRAEKLLLDRRRRGENQQAAAKRLKTTLKVYREWERGGEGAPETKLGRLEKHEDLFLLRHRSGMTIAKTAKKVGCCRYWLVQMERGQAPVAQLEEYWKKAS